MTLPWLFFSPLPLIFARSVLWVCHVDSPQIENPSNLSNFLSVQLLNHDFKKKSLWEPPRSDNEKYHPSNPNISGIQDWYSRRLSSGSAVCEDIVTQTDLKGSYYETLFYKIQIFSEYYVLYLLLRPDNGK